MLNLINANASVIAVTDTATLLTDLIDTAAGADQQFPPVTKGCTLIPEDGDVRILFDGNTPTASKGILLKQGGVYSLSKDVDLSQLKLIRTGASNVAVGIIIGSSVEGPALIGGAASGSGSQSAGADGESNTTNAQYVSARMQGFGGSTWDRIRAGITTVTGTLTGWLNNLPWAIYHTSQTARTDGQGGPFEAGAAGQILVDLYSALSALVGGVERDNVGAVPFRRADAFQDISYDTTHSASAVSIKAATASKKHYVTDLTISSTVAATITIDDADGTVLEKVIFPAAGIFRATYPTPLVTAAVNKALRVTSSVSSGTLTVKGRGYTI